MYREQAIKQIMVLDTIPEKGITRTDVSCKIKFKTHNNIPSIFATPLTTNL
jgi:hypothetical protein